MRAASHRWHRRLALLAGIAALIWASSGLLHPLMSWTNPTPAAMKPPESARPAIPSASLSELLATAGLAEIQGARWLVHQGLPQVQITVDATQPRRYWTWPSGTETPDADRQHAEALARHYTGEQDAAVAQAEWVGAFDADYPSVNRLLPVWKITFDRPDQLTAYVDTGSDRLGALNDRRKRVLLMLFQNLHKLEFLRLIEALRVPAVTALVSSVLLAALLGLAMLITLRRKTHGARRVHRALGTLVVIPVLMLTSSGLFHVLTRSALWEPTAEPPQALSSTSLNSTPVVEAGGELRLLVQFAEQAWWRVEERKTARYRHVSTGQVLEEFDWAAEWARRYGIPASEPERVKGFSDEYGFANKRLPVWRVPLTNGEVLFVDATEGLIAGRSSALLSAEGWSFSTLHKWQFLNPIGREKRDALLMFFAALLVVMAVIGLRMRKRA